MKKRLLAAGCSAVLAATLLFAKKKKKSEDKSYQIGIQQFAEHESLNNCRKGFIQGLEKEGIKEGKI